MVTTLLFDLDGTLIELDRGLFLKKYFELLIDKFSHLFNPQDFYQAILASTQKMMDDTDPSKTNQQVFIENFVTRIDQPLEKLQPLFDDFYENDFGRLKRYAKTKPEARLIMKEAFARGVGAVIATNPVFPLRAIEHRLDWAGVGDFDFELITSYENMHFCKPHRGYYLEVMEKVGASPEECLMIGNDIGDDMAASKVGIKTYLVEDTLIDDNTGDYKPDFSGSLADLMAFLGPEFEFL